MNTLARDDRAEGREHECRAGIALTVGCRDVRIGLRSDPCSKRMLSASPRPRWDCEYSEHTGEDQSRGDAGAIPKHHISVQTIADHDSSSTVQVPFARQRVDELR